MRIQHSTKGSNFNESNCTEINRVGIVVVYIHYNCISNINVIRSIGG